MSKRTPDEINKGIIEALHALGLLGIDLSERYQKDAVRRDRAESYRRVGQMLEALAYNIRDPLLVALWEKTGTGSNMRVEWANEFNRREAAFAAVYLLWKRDRQKVMPACKTVAKLTGEKVETLRQHFKGLALPDYEKSPAGARTLLALENARRAFRAEPHWRQIYELLIEAALAVTDDLETDRQRLSRL